MFRCSSACVYFRLESPVVTVDAPSPDLIGGAHKIIYNLYYF